jgi:hypothetical protein
VTTRLAKLALLPAVVVGAACLSRPARADGDKATAEALFSEGRRLMSNGNYAAACEKFAASQKHDPGLGTSLNLADCYEKSGRTASAWAEFRDAAAAAHRGGQKEREQVARARADALEKQLSRLTLTEKSPHPDQRISRDGASVDRGVLGTAVPLDPGAHLVEVMAPGRKKWSKSVDVQPGAQIVIELPELEKDSAGATAPVGAASDSTPSTSKSGNTQRIAAIAVGGVGVVGLAVGSIFGLKAISNWSDVKSHCRSYPNDCDGEGMSLADSASSAATISTIAFAVGAAGIAGGAILWFTAPMSREAAAAPAPLRVGFDGRQLLLRGTFE